MSIGDKKIGNFFEDHFFKIMGFAFTVLNLWLTTRLGAVDSQLRLHNQRITALEVLTTDFASREVTAVQIEKIEERLFRIEDKVDILLGNRGVN